MSNHAVLTGDIVNSTRLKPATEKKLLQQLAKSCLLTGLNFTGATASRHS